MEDRQVSYEWPSDEVAYQGVVETVPQRKGKTWQAQVKVMSWKPAGDSLQATGQWKKVDRSILLYWMPDTTGQTILQCGDKICFYTSVSRPVSDVDFRGSTMVLICTGRGSVEPDWLLPDGGCVWSRPGAGDSGNRLC